MPTFDVTSEVDQQEIRNAMDQASRELGNRFDFKGTDTSVEFDEKGITLKANTEDRINAARQVVEEKLVKRKVSLKGVAWGKIEDAAGGSVRQHASLAVGISSDRAKELNKFIKELGLKGVQSQGQGDQLRVIGKKRDDLQEVINAMKEHDFGIPLQFGNFRD